MAWWLKRLGFVFIASRLSYALLGVKFIYGDLQAWQFIDPALLRTDLLRSVFYQHSQPPLFNLFTGAVLQSFSTASTLVFQAIFIGFGLVFCIVHFYLMLRLGVSRRVAFLIAAWFSLSPSVVLYENWFFYTFPLAVLLLLAALALLDFVERKRGRGAAVFFGLLAIISLTQSTFHPFFVLLTLAALLWGLPDLRRRLLRGAVVPLSLLLLVSFKNVALFRTPAYSSWLGMSLARVVMVNVPEPERQRYVDEGKLSPLAMIEPFEAVERYPAAYHHVRGFEDVPVLSEMRKSTGETNYNHLGFLGISKQYLADSLSLIKAKPAAYLKGVARSCFVYTKSTSDYGWLIDNRTRLFGWDELYNRVFYGRVRMQAGFGHVRGARGEPYDVYLLLILGLPALLFYGLWLGVGKGAVPSRLTRAQRVPLLFMCACIAYVAAVGNLVEAGENNRFRFMTDALSFCVLGLVVERLVQAASRRVART
ncbi:MAG: hypothetical protein EOO73_14915 [Myxococcales bacterium]|nr:MAG: hypothetical protein EOO73_14915 [Myxococcales bacterium]